MKEQTVTQHSINTPYCVCWRKLATGVTGRAPHKLHKLEAEQLCKKLNRQNRGWAEHWVEPVEQEATT